MNIIRHVNVVMFLYSVLAFSNIRRTGLINGVVHQIVRFLDSCSVGEEDVLLLARWQLLDQLSCRTVDQITASKNE